MTTEQNEIEQQTPRPGVQQRRVRSEMAGPRVYDADDGSVRARSDRAIWRVERELVDSMVAAGWAAPD
ncbi:hypothetical protein GCM10028775_46450 [Catellatospora paridis]|uniref:hypothetical protein n=1 Tax=Catellatospora paridis TaxID=1617086 RepID=UPI0012D39F17|nr:hypothetical protein [Catellatospora paridis]